MNTRSLQIGDLEVELDRKQIKNLHLGVYPPNGRVRIAAPPTVSEDAVRVAVVSRLGWIKRHMRAFQEQSRQSERLYVSGETHYHLGQQYRLKLIESGGASCVSIASQEWIELRVPTGSDRDFKERAFQRWQRNELRQRTADLVSVWACKLEIAAPELSIKKMKTKWGSCSSTGYRIWLNLELIKKPPECLSYIVLHEMAHLIEPNHGDRFVALLNRHMPNWRSQRDRLNSLPLRSEQWPKDVSAVVEIE
ncbi:M48 family metallopeptidase [Erythrobacter sp. YT30]|uniref:M48 family metallopeptidase n=1 Tax=Erythrobacter sp. YT30 TaxID=1735012 RepID=UPI00076C85FE|nr:SprT family zinc-dependent metalloprotease [Erythrobacter sp. YT30]KWV91744.1 metal-dependent hydrolase [Erythrobacter sp. YT30]